jgi:hypothetical protein
MAGRQAANVVTRYAGIQVQTSALGVSIPLGWGTFRCKCNLMDYLDFKSTPQKGGKAGGKGGQQTTGYSYKATIILAICEGPIDSISAVYVDSNIYIDGAKTALQQANLNMFTGAAGQPVWNYLTSHHPDHAIGYSGLAIAFQSNYALEASAAPPNHSFEVVRLSGFGVAGSEDADPSIVLADFFQNTRTGVPLWPTSGLLGSMSQYQDYCLAAGLLISPVIEQQQSASEFVTEVLKATNSTCVWSEGVLKFIPYGDTGLSGAGKTYTPSNTPVYSLTDDDFVQDKSGEPVLQVDIQDQSDAYNVVQLEYLDRTNQYNMAIALASDAANVAQYGARRKDPDTVHCICDPKVAAISAQLYLQRTLYIRAQYRFKLGWMFALLEPGDIVELTDAGLGLAGYSVRVIQIDEDEKYGLSFICEDYPVGVAHTPLYEMQNGLGFAANQSIDPGGPEANLLLWSDDPTNAVWSKTNVSITANATTDQYGLNLAASVVTSAGSGVHGLSQPIGSFEDLTYTFRVCLQKNVRKNVRVTLADSGNTNGGYIEVDLNAGAILTPGTVLGSAYVLSATMAQSLVSGIWVVSITVEVPTATTLYASVDVLSDAGAHSWTAAGENAIYVSQFQLRQGLSAGAYAATQGTAAGPYLFNPPSVLTQGQQGEVWAAVAGGPYWGGCIVWTSVDGASYQQVGTIHGSARYGVATTGLAGASDPDTTHNLGVDLGASGGALTGASQASVDNGGTMCLLDQELIGYEAATLTNPSRYTLGTYIRRGFQNTPIAAHSVGAPLVRLDDALFQFPYLASTVGQTVYAKFQGFNLWGKATQDLANCIAYSVTPGAMAAAGPAASAWSVVGGTVTSGSIAVPALLITGALDNPAASAVLFFYKVHGGSTWLSAGSHAPTITIFDVTSVVSGVAYDVGAAYLVNGVTSAVTTIGSNVTVGTQVAASLNNQGDLATMNTVGSTSGTIDSGGVGTTQVAANAISNAVSTFTSSIITVTSAAALATVSITTTGSNVQILAEAVNMTGQYGVSLSLYRDSTLIYSTTANGLMPIMLTDSPSAGAHTYTLYGASTGTGNNIENRYMSVTELKR